MEKRKARRRLTALAAAVLVGALGASAANAAKTVYTRGGLEFQPNQYLKDTLRFSPGAITVRPNERVTWIDGDNVPDPHTITIVNQRSLPDTVDELFNCQACSLANNHLADPNDPNSDIARMRVNVGKPGMNTHGDSLVLTPGGRISGQVTARLGSRIHYFCAIHPWMQGSIRVARAGTSGGGGGGAGLTGRHSSH